MCSDPVTRAQLASPLLLQLFVETLLRCQAFKELMNTLRSITWEGRPSYEIRFHCVNSLNFGLPQHRERLYIVGVHRGLCPDGPKLKLPVGTSPAPDLLKFLGSPSPVKRRRMPSQATAKKNIRLAKLRIWKRLQVKSSSVPAVVDLANGRGLNMRLNACPTITRSRGGGRDFWVTSLGRRLSAWELLMLQGASKKDMDFSCSLSEVQVGHMVGNAMSAAP